MELFIPFMSCCKKHSDLETEVATALTRCDQQGLRGERGRGAAVRTSCTADSHTVPGPISVFR